MIKLLHTSDWHLGKSIYGRSLLPDQEYFIREVFLPAVRRERPDCVLLCGDIYDRPVAPVEAIRLFDETVTALAEWGVPLAAITGNHDGADRVALGASLLREKGIAIVNRLGPCEPIRLSDGGQRVDLYPLPYFEPEQARAFFGDNDIRGFHDAYRAVLRPIRESLDPESCSILLAHCFVAGASVSDSENPLSVGGSAQVGAELFDGFAYVALGHLHGPQRAGSNARYSGSPLSYSFDECHQTKSMTLLEIERREVSVRLLPVPPLREMREISGTFRELMEQGKQAPSEDYLFAHITDRSPVYLPMEQLREYYPNLLGLDNGWLAAEAGGLTPRRKQGEQEIFEAFLSQICGQEPTPSDRETFAAILEQLNKEEHS